MFEAFDTKHLTWKYFQKIKQPKFSFLKRAPFLDMHGVNNLKASNMKILLNILLHVNLKHLRGGD